MIPQALPHGQACRNVAAGLIMTCIGPFSHAVKVMGMGLVVWRSFWAHMRP